MPCFNMSHKKFTLIVSGGNGSRLKSTTPKQFIIVAGKPLLMHTLEAFHRYDPEMDLILVLAQKDLTQWEVLCRRYHFTLPLTIATGGASRFHSVKNGLHQIEGEGLVAIHDGARPMVTREVISRCFEAAAEYGNAVAAVPLKDSIRRMTGEGSKAVDRSAFRIIQTPQVFQVNRIKEAYARAADPGSFTDDASVAESFGEKIYLTAGSFENIKVTTPEDLHLAETLLAAR